MNISEIPSAIYAGRVIEGKAPTRSTRHNHYEKKLAMDWNSSLDKKLLSRHLSIVYFMVVDGEVMKIGQTSGKGGLKAGIKFYLTAGFGDDGQPRFVINGLWREAMAKGKQVDVYFIYMEPIEVEVPGITGLTKMTVPISAKGMEENCLHEFYERSGAYPEWNFQERGVPAPQHLYEAFAAYKVARGKSRA